MTEITEQKQQELFEINISALNAMDIASASMIKALIMALSENATYIKLYDAMPNGYHISYQFVAGEESLVNEIATALGITVTGNKLETAHG